MEGIQEKLKHGIKGWELFLVMYFLALLILSLYFSIWLLWKPLEISPSENMTLVRSSPANQNLTSSNDANPLVLSSEETSTLNATGLTIKNITTKIIGNQQITETTIHSSASSADKEIRLIALSALFGIVGSSIHGVTSLTVWASQDRLRRSYFGWYVTRPPIGAALAVTVYLLLRASLLSGVADVGSGFINDYGVAGISALVGLMTAQMTKKLRDVFDSLFGIEKGSDKGEIGISDTNISVIPEQLQIIEGEESAFVAQVKDNDGAPIPKISTSYAIVDTDIVKTLEVPFKETDNNGVSAVRIKGIKKGKTNVIVTAKFDDKTVNISANVSVDGQDKAAVADKTRT
jgi:hypothetical protein